MKPSPINPLGAKGAGEGGIIAAGGVMANAVANALASLGVEARELPLAAPRGGGGGRGRAAAGGGGGGPPLPPSRRPPPPPAPPPPLASLAGGGENAGQ